MFPHEQGVQDGSRLRRHSLPPLRLPRLRSHAHSVGGSISFQNQNIDSSRYLQDTNPEHQRFRSLSLRPRGRSLEDDSVYLHTMLPSVTSLMPSQKIQCQQNLFNSAATRHQHRQWSSPTQFSSARYQAQTLPYDRSPLSPAHSSTTALNLPVRRSRIPTPVPVLSAYTDQPIEMQRAAPLNHRLNRWSPYASTSVSVRGIASDHIATPWEDEEDQNTQHHRRRRTSPRKRLAASKARAQTFRMREQPEVYGRFENSHIGYHLPKRNYGGPPLRFVPPFSTVPGELSLSISQSPIFVHDSDTSPSKNSSRYKRGMDRQTVLRRLDCRERHSAPAKEFCVNRAAICNINKHREHVLPYQHQNLLAKHLKEARHKEMSADEIDAKDAAQLFQHQSNRISLLLSDDTLIQCDS